MKPIVIFGAGVMARMAHFYFSNDSEREVVAFAVHADYKNGDDYLGLPLISSEDLLKQYPPVDYDMFVALSYTGMNRPRAETYFQMKALGYSLVSYTSSHCTYLSQTPPGDNCFILEDNTIQPFVTIGDNVFLWSGNHIGHDVVLEDHCFFTSHCAIGGFSRIGAYSFIGPNVTVIDNVVIGERSMLSTGAAILKDTEPGSVYAVPRARRLKISSDRIKL